MDYTEFKFSYERENEKKSEPKKNPKGAVLVVIILIVFLLSLFLSGKLLERDIVQEISSVLVKRNVKKYYVVCLEKLDFLTDANAYSKKVRSGGGAGYVIKENNAYFVALATYLTKKEAEAVAEKNDKSVVKEMSFNLRKYLDGVTDDGTSKTALNTIFSSIDELINLSFSYDEKSITFSDATRRAELQKNELLNLKMELTEKPLKNGEELLNFIEPLIAVTQNLTEDNLAKNLRYGICGTLDRLNNFSL